MVVGLPSFHFRKLYTSSSAREMSAGVSTDSRWKRCIAYFTTCADTLLAIFESPFVNASRVRSVSPGWLWSHFTGGKLLTVMCGADGTCAAGAGTELSGFAVPFGNAFAICATAKLVQSI